MSNNTDLSLDQLKSFAGGWQAGALVVIAKEGPRTLKFYADTVKNLSEGKPLGASVVAAGHSSGTIKN